MAKRSFRPEDGLRLNTATDPDLSPGRPAGRVRGHRTDERATTGRARRSGWRPLDGSAPARRFTEGPADKSPRWSPDGRWLAYISITDDRARPRSCAAGAARRRRADAPRRPAGSGQPARVVARLDADRRRLPRRGSRSRRRRARAERNAPRVVRGLAARLDGVGWQDGRRHLFLVDVEGGSAAQLTRGDYDHDDPVVLAGRRRRSCSPPTATRAATTASSEATPGSSPPAAAGPAASRTARAASPSRCSLPTGRPSRSRAGHRRVE